MLLTLHSGTGFTVRCVALVNEFRGTPVVVGSRRWVGSLAGILLALATVLFVGGALIERNSHTDVTGPTAHAETSESAASVEGAQPASDVSEFHPIGINIEQPALITIGAAVSILVAVMVVWRSRRWLLALAGADRAGIRGR